MWTLNPIKQQVQTSHLQQEFLLYSALFLNMMITVMNTSMFNVALPDIASEFSLTPLKTSMMVSCYSVVYALCTVLYGRLSGMVPLSSLLTFGMTCLGIGSAIGVMADHFPVLIAARVVQAAGACSISALGIIITSRYIPAARRGAAMGKIAAAVTLGFGLGPLVGGMITEYFGWSYLFVITLCSIITIPVYQSVLPKEERKKVNVDYLGFGYLAIGIVSGLITLAVQNYLLLAGVPFIFLFWKHIHQTSHPFVTPSLLKNTVFIRLTGIAFVMFFINFSILFISPLLLKGIHDVSSAAKIGLILFPGAFCSSIFSIFLGRLVDRIGAKKIIGGGIGCMFTASLTLSSFSYISEWVILIFFMVSSTGFVCITTSIPNYLSQILPEDEVNVGIGTLQLFQYIGGAAGVTISGLAIDYLSLPYAVNPLWKHSDNMFSQAYLLLFILSIAAGRLFYPALTGSKTPVPKR